MDQRSTFLFPYFTDNVYEQPVDSHLTNTGQQSSTEEDYEYTYSSNLPASKRKNDIGIKNNKFGLHQRYIL